MPTSHRAPLTLHKQSGAALIISMVMLLVLTILGITSMQVTTLEERMSGSERDYNAAFQAAESDLRAGELAIESAVSEYSISDLCRKLGLNDADDQRDVTVTGHFYLLPDTWNVNGEAKPCIIKHVSTERLQIGGYGEAPAGGPVSYFRVTSRNTGESGRSHVVLQTFYGKRF